MTLPPPVLSRSGIDGTAVRGVQSINHHHYTRKVCISTTQKTEHKTIQSGMKSLMRVFCSSVAVLSGPGVATPLTRTNNTDEHTLRSIHRRTARSAYEHASTYVRTHTDMASHAMHVCLASPCTLGSRGTNYSQLCLGTRPHGQNCVRNVAGCVKA